MTGAFEDIELTKLNSCQKALSFYIFSAFFCFD